MKLRIGLLMAISLLAGELLAQPSITTQPTNRIVISGSSVTFSVVASGAGPFTYQWQFNGTNLPTTNIITTVAGNGNLAYSGDGGPATNASISFPHGIAIDASGNLFIADYNLSCVRKVDTNGIITTVAGRGIYGSSGDGGAATNAKLEYPSGVAIDASGNLFISDYNDRRVRKVDTNGIITTVAGMGIYGSSGDGGAATNAMLKYPSGVAIEASGNLFITDYNDGRVRKVNTNGIITTVAGGGSSFGDGGAATNAYLNNPNGAAVDASGNLFIADVGNHRVRRVDANGIITTVAGNGSLGFSGDGGQATNACLWNPDGVVLDPVGNLFIADWLNYRIRKVDTNGIITTVAGGGSSLGDGGAATNGAITPYGVALDSAGNLFIADSGSCRVCKVVLNGLPTLTMKNVKTNNAGNYAVIISNPYGSVTSSIVTLMVGFRPSISAQPSSVTVTNGGTAGFTVAAIGTEPFGYQWCLNNAAVDGGTNATLPIANVSPDQTGSYYCVITNAYGSVTSRIAVLAIGLPPGFTTQPTNGIVVSGNNATLSVAVSGTGPFTYQWQLNGTNLPNNIITTVAGGGTNYPGDGGAATNANLYFPYGAAVDARGYLFIADTAHGRVCQVNTNGVITTIANTGLFAPGSVAADGYGNLFIADTGNYRIRMVDTNGIVTTVAGNGISGYTGDGGAATIARLNNPQSAVVDASGNLLIADTSNNRIRKVSVNGIITTVAGNGTAGFSGDGGAATNAKLSGPYGVAVDPAGNLFIADTSNSRIRKMDTNSIITTVASSLGAFGVAVDAFGNLFIPGGGDVVREMNTNGVITIVAGNGSLDFSGDGGAATNAGLFGAMGVAVDASGNLFIADSANCRIREVSLAGSPTLMLNNATTANAGNYTVVITSPYGSVTSSVVALTVLVPPSVSGMVPNSDGAGSVSICLAGGANEIYLVQAATNLTPPVIWQTISTNTAGADGTWQFTDTNAPNYPDRFYRISTP